MALVQQLSDLTDDVKVLLDYSQVSCGNYYYNG